MGSSPGNNSMHWVVPKQRQHYTALTFTLYQIAFEVAIVRLSRFLSCYQNRSLLATLKPF